MDDTIIYMALSLQVAIDSLQTALIYCRHYLGKKKKKSLLLKAVTYFSSKDLATLAAGLFPNYRHTITRDL